MMMNVSKLLHLVAPSLLLGLAAMGLHAEPIPSPATSKISAGQRIYLEGLLPSGALLRASLQGGVTVSGRQAACVNCHKRSGLGGYEGQVEVPPIAGRILFAAHSTGAAAGAGRYTRASLKDTIREGIQPKGRVLNPLMPRYNLKDAEADALIAYLETLAPDNPPGIESQRLHIATIVSDDVPADRREVMLNVLRQGFLQSAPAVYKTRTEAAFAARKQRLPNFAPLRQWQLDIWELTGPRHTWGAQLERYYRRQPAFTLVGGLVGGSWRPIHEFCERHQVPCLFPNTVEPVVDEGGIYNVYFSKGLHLEGEAVGKHLADHDGRGRRTIQVFRSGDSAAELAVTGLREEARELGLQGIRSIEVKKHVIIGRRFWERLLRSNSADTLVLWLRPADIKGIDGLDKIPHKLRRIYVSSTLAETLQPPLPDALRSLARVVHRQLMPDTPGFEKSLEFMRTSGLELPNGKVDQWVMGDTLWAVRLLTEALRQLKYPSREFMLETIEMLVSRQPGLFYPRLALGTDQRFASKGCFIANPLDVSQSEWVVP